MRIRSPHKPWTHMARIIDIDEFANNMLISLVDEDGSQGPEKVVGYPRLTIITEIKGQTVPVALEEEDWISQLHPGYTSIDSVSLSLMRMLSHPLEALYRFWMTTDCISPKQIFTCEDSSTIEFTGRRYHWNGTNRGVTFQTNSVSFEGEVPQAKLMACKMKTLREVVDHPAIPKKAVATGGWTGNGTTTITYDVEDVYMDDLFGDLARHATMKEGKRFDMEREKKGKMK